MKRRKRTKAEQAYVTGGSDYIVQRTSTDNKHPPRKCNTACPAPIDTLFSLILLWSATGGKGYAGVPGSNETRGLLAPTFSTFRCQTPRVLKPC